MELFEQYKYPIIGGLLGLIIAVLLMTFGLFKTIIAILFIVLGIYAGLFVKRTGILDQFMNRK